MRFTGDVLHRETLPRELCPQNDYYLQIGPDTFLGPSGEVDDFINHSCDPNTGLVVETDIGAGLVALRPIAAGDTVCFDYSTSMLNAPCTMACACGSANCRGVVEDFSLLPARVRQAYIDLGVVADYLVSAGAASPA